MSAERSADYVRARGESLWLWCPGCDDSHRILIAGPLAWQWNGDVEKPTISPSIKVTGVQWAPDQGFYKPTHHVEAGQETVCHSFVTDGRWGYLSDCTHHMAGQDVALSPLPKWMADDDE